MNKLVIIDGNAIVHRAYHAIPPMTTKSGAVVNAVYGFTSMLLKVIHDLKPTHFAVTFDVKGGSTARLKKFKEYKGTRVAADQALYDQIPLCHEVVRAFGIPIYEKTGYEADDVIGTIVKQVQSSQFGVHRASETKNSEPRTPNSELYIVTGDMDTLQLVQNGVKVYGLRKGMSDIVIYDADAVKARYGFGPELMVDYKALRGDPSDNIPGVPGIGEKGATELIQKFGGIEAIYQEIKKTRNQPARNAAHSAAGGEIKLAIKDGMLKKLIEGEEKAKMSFELAKLDCDVPGLDFKLADCELKEFDHEKIATLFQKFEFVSLMKRLPGEKSEILNSKSETNLKPKTQNLKLDFKYTELKKAAEVDNLIKKIRDAKRFACRAITSGANVIESKLVGLVFVVENEGYFVVGDLVSAFKNVFEDANIELIGHDLKQLVKTLVIHCHFESPSPFGPLKATLSQIEWVAGGEESLSQSTGRQRSLGGVDPARDDNEKKATVSNPLFDTMIAAYLLQPGSRSHDIPSIVLKTLGKELTASSGQESLFGVDAKVACHELYLITLAAEKLKQELIEADNLGLFEKIEMPLIPILAEMELNGIAVDKNKLAELSKEVNSSIKSVTAKIYDLAGREFNISSPLQLREILFEELEIPVAGIKKGKTGLSTAAEQLEKMRGLHPIIDLIQDYREVTKLQNTYIDVLPTLINKTTDRIHTTFNQAVTATGRLSSSDPNMQNIPARTELGREIRGAFIAEDGNLLVSADYSQIELRIVASLANDKKMLEIFEQGLDIHTATAAAIHGVPLDKVTKEMRFSAKEVNFGVLYGMGAYGLAWRADIPQFEAKAFIEKYFSEFSGVKKYLEDTIKFARESGYVETLFGRRRYIPELNAGNFQLRASGERMAVNHPVQGTAADLMKLAMIKVSEEIKKLEIRKLSDERVSLANPLSSRRGAGGEVSPIRMILQVHDELVLEVPKNEVTEVDRLLKQTMENVTKMKVPILVEVKAGKNWNELMPVKL